MNLIDFLVKISDWFWGPPLLIILVGGGLYLSVRLGFFQFRYLGFILKQTFGNMFKKSEGEVLYPPSKQPQRPWLPPLGDPTL